MGNFLSKHHTDTSFDDFPFEDTLVVRLVEKLHIASSAIIQTIFDGYIIDEGFILLGRVAGRYGATDDDTETIVPETLGKLEIVIRSPSSFGIAGRFHAETDVHRLTHHVRYLILEERVESIVHIESARRISIRHVHAGHKHCHGQLTPFFHTHGIELFLYGGIFGCFERKCQAKRFQAIGQEDAHIETHHARSFTITTHIRTDAFSGLDVHLGVHHVARPIQITSILNMEGLERNNRDFIFQFSADDRITAIEAHFALRCVLECQVATTFHFHIVGAIGSKVYMSLHGLIDGDGHGNVHASERSSRLTGFFHRHGIVEVYKFHHVAQAVVYHERRILQDVSEIRLTQNVHVPTHLQLIHGTFQSGIHIYINLSVSGRTTILRCVHQLVVVGLHAKVYHHLFHVGEIH